jgi:hypothetical protein
MSRREQQWKRNSFLGGIGMGCAAMRNIVNHEMSTAEQRDKAYHIWNLLNELSESMCKDKRDPVTGKTIPARKEKR